MSDAVVAENFAMNFAEVEERLVGERHNAVAMPS